MNHWWKLSWLLCDAELPSKPLHGDPGFPGEQLLCDECGLLRDFGLQLGDFGCFDNEYELTGDFRLQSGDLGLCADE